MSLAYFARNVRSGERSRRKMRREGYNMRGDQLWTNSERQVLLELRGDYDAMSKRLPHRSLNALYGQCAKMRLRKSIHVWTAADISKLRKLYPRASVEEICGALPHSTWVNIQQVARYRGFRRLRRPYKVTGIPALDDVRARCYEIGWSMRDLDKAARTGRYFSRAGWVGKKRINHRALGRAIEALDGVVQAQWND
ncbi:hypothetical protein IE4872_CH01618 [Rhizobium gallicum]|uniref:Uncharacterized protein n=1 Tax=Rhizobium gallicum TaxID=56730 RepID=A0A1L5NH95_9HYPH|nr:hypothetical protein IE4872_CH01618 [Rhizobium gallicum]